VFLISELLGEVLEDFDFSYDLVDQAKKLFMVIKSVNLKRQGFKKKITLQMDRQLSSLVDQVNLGILGSKTTQELKKFGTVDKKSI
jgi:hypothetical protein